jgi:peptidoglycan/xylan/chitin deacetylase (PgdA/CDA1 family)
MYHRVSQSGDSLTVSPENFESQISWLARNGYITLTADEFARFLHGSTMPRKSVLLTFDDGYLDNYVHAHSILLRYGLNAVMFLVTGRVHDGPFRAIEAQRMEAPRSHQACERLVYDGRADEVTVRWSEVELMRAAATFEFHSHTHSHLRWVVR